MSRHIIFAALVAVAGCSDDAASDHTAQDTGTTATDSSTDDSGTDSGASNGDAAAGDTLAVKPATPEITNVMPMAGAWHVTWKLNDTGLSKVELWRSNDGATATLVRAFAGTAKDWHDAAATGTTIKYCYTVKTFRGELASDPSAERCTK